MNHKDGENIYGIDFSQGMIDIAQEFIQWDFNLGVPPELKHKKFEFIILLKNKEELIKWHHK